MRARPAACVALLALAGAGCGGTSDEKPSATLTSAPAVTAAVTTGETGSGTPTAVPEPRYVLGATVSCLGGRPVTLVSGAPTDPRIRALYDLAQRRTVQVRVDRSVVGLAITRRATDARLLAELLRVPDDRYRIVRRGNAVLLFRRSARAVSMTVLGCLRPR